MTLAGIAAAWGRIPGQAKAAAAVAALVLAVLALAYCAGRGDGARKVENRALKDEVKFQRQIGNAVATAADERAADTVRITEQERKAHEAIASAPDSAPGPAAVAHNCERLRRAGQVDPRCAQRR